MSSAIDVTKPVTGSPTTASVRSNFAAAKSEIEALQTGKQDSGSYALTTTNLTAGTGLSGGGTLAANRTFSVNYGTVSGTAAQGNDSRINNGQTAYGWGDHAAAGYATGNATITLSGDVSGSGTTSIAVTVANDSHTHANGTITSLDAAKVNTGTFANARISQASVTQHAAASRAAVTTAVKIGTWTISDVGGKLVFSNGSSRFSVSATGAVIAGDNITAFGTP